MGVRVDRVRGGGGRGSAPLPRFPPPRPPTPCTPPHPNQGQGWPPHFQPGRTGPHHTGLRVPCQCVGLRLQLPPPLSMRALALRAPSVGGSPPRRAPLPLASSHPLSAHSLTSLPHVVCTPPPPHPTPPGRAPHPAADLHPGRAPSPSPPPLPPQDVRLTQQLIDERLGAELLGRVAFYGQSEVSALLEVWGMWEREGGGEVHGHIARPRPPHPGPRPLAHPPRPRWPPPTRSLAPLPSAHPPPMRAATVERPRLQGRAGAAG